MHRQPQCTPRLRQKRDHARRVLLGMRLGRAVWRVDVPIRPADLLPAGQHGDPGVHSSRGHQLRQQSAVAGGGGGLIANR